MKNTKRCPKCESNYILRIPANPNYLEGNVHRLGFMGLSTVPDTRFVCGKCGFSEEWIESAEDITKLLPLHVAD